ncbi:MAG TPA: hypothetical protein VGZ26_04580 [Pirellulales bacterium]|jgi:hypothetical protein|nr:hypothetical protein [Pirellulales bacterium]
MTLLYHTYLVSGKELLSIGPTPIRTHSIERSVTAVAWQRKGCAIAIALAVAFSPGTCAIALGESLPSERPPVPAAVTAKLLRYAQFVVRHYDANQSGQLESDEWPSMHGKPELADSNHDGLMTVAEYAQYCADYGAGRAIRLSTLPGEVAAHEGSRDSSPPGDDHRSADPAATGDAESAQLSAEQDRRRDTKYFASLPLGVPQWFIRRDADGDGQLTLSEYSPKLLRSEIDDFNRYDSNRDGILTVAELLRAGKDAKGNGPATPAN